MDGCWVYDLFWRYRVGDHSKEHRYQVRIRSLCLADLGKSTTPFLQNKQNMDDCSFERTPSSHPYLKHCLPLPTGVKRFKVVFGWAALFTQINTSLALGRWGRAPPEIIKEVIYAFLENDVCFISFGFEVGIAQEQE